MRRANMCWRAAEIELENKTLAGAWAFGFMILSTSLLVARLLFVVTGRGKLENHTIFTKIITYKSISKNT